MALQNFSFKSRLKNLKQYSKRILSDKRARPALFIAAFVTVGIVALLATRAAGPFASIEVENGTPNRSDLIVSDSTASGGNAVRFNASTPPPPTSGTMPTPENTGPTSYPTQTMTADQFLSSKSCDNKRITDTVVIETNNMSGYAGTTITVNNCVFEQGFRWNESSSAYGLSQYPTLNMINTEIKGTFNTFVSFKGTWDRVKATNGWNLVHSTDCAGSMCGPTREIPLTVKNSYFSAAPLTAPCGYHGEAFHAWGNGSNYTFINTRFVQHGEGSDPYAFCHTGAIYQEGGGGVTYDGCYFDDGSPTQQHTYIYTINIDGSGTFGSQNVVKNSFIERGSTYAINPRAESDGSQPATYSNNFDFNTRSPISIP